MIAQKTAHKPSHISKNLATCANCPYFDDFNETSGRGWCKMLDTVARKHHPKTQDCHWAIESHEKGLAVAELPPCPYCIGQLAKIVDPEVADCSLWQTYVVVGKKYNSGRYRSTSAYVKETSWYFGLKNIDGELDNRPEIWVGEDGICKLDRSANINMAGEF